MGPERLSTKEVTPNFIIEALLWNPGQVYQVLIFFLEEFSKIPTY